MANDCLVTKLKGVVDNPDLPILNTIRVNLLPSALRKGTEETILVGRGSSAVVIESQVPFHVGTAANPAVTEYTIPDDTVNGLQNFIFLASDMPSNSVDNAVKISGGIYDLKSLIYYHYCGWFKIADADNTTLGYASDMVNQVCTPDVEASGGIKILCIDDKEASNNLRTYPSVLPTPKTGVKMVWGLAVDNAMNVPIVDKNVLANVPNVEHLNLRFYGDIKDLPLNAKVLYKPSSSTTGSLEEFVANRRSNGKTSGVIAFYCPTSAESLVWVVTYNGVAIKDMTLVERPIIDNWSYFTWDASTMGFASSAPAGCTTYNSLYTATTDAINGGL